MNKMQISWAFNDQEIAEAVAQLAIMLPHVLDQMGKALVALAEAQDRQADYLDRSLKRALAVDEVNNQRYEQDRAYLVERNTREDQLSGEERQRRAEELQLNGQIMTAMRALIVAMINDRSAPES